MALCDLCQTVPFTALPRLPGEGRGTMRLADNTESPQIMFHSGDEFDSPYAELPDPIGFPFHQDLGALANSAQSCPVCNIAQAGVQGWIDRWEDAAKNNTFFIEFHMKDDPIPTGQQLWLTACDDGEQGFCLWAKNPGRSKSLYLLAVVRLYVGPTSRVAEQFPVRPLELDSASDASLEFVASWVQKCTSEHATGRCSEGSMVLPTRVLDIASEEDSDIIKLVDGTHQKGQYASLSYCWGKAPPYLTSRENMAARRAGIDIRKLPQTFRDAVTISRRLSLRYLWIDSLCICQDDANDWARESSRMADVYSNAHIVIAANRSSDCSGGIFHTRVARPSTVFKLPGGENDVQTTLLFPSDQFMGWSSTEFPGEPLTKRGWALQERVLGKRVIHYNDRQIYFECDHGIFAEDGSHQERHCRLNDGLSPSHESSTASESLSGDKADLLLWYGLVWAYGKRKLSKPTDRMPAISGLARLFHRRLGGEYVAGLWSKAMIEGLAWQGLGDRAPASRDQYIGPSWSWTGYAGIGAMGLNPGWLDTAEILDWHVDLKHEANPFGEVQGAWIRIRGPAIQLRHSTLESNEHEDSLGRAGLRPLPRVCTPHSESEEGSIMKTDDKDVTLTSEWKDWRLEVLILGGYKEDRSKESQAEDDESGQAMGSFYGLVVRSAGDEKTGKMQRVGWMFLDGKEGSKIREDDANWKTVTLV